MASEPDGRRDLAHAVVDEETYAWLIDLARQTASALRQAGLNAEVSGDGVSEGVRDEGGAEVEIDRSDDEWGGVAVVWRPPKELLLDIEQALLGEAEGDHPVLRHNWEVHVAMTDAMQRILESAQFDVAVDDRNDYAPHTLYVSRGPAIS